MPDLGRSRENFGALPPPPPREVLILGTETLAVGSAGFALKLCPLAFNKNVPGHPDGGGVGGHGDPCRDAVGPEGGDVKALSLVGQLPLSPDRLFSAAIRLF